MTPLYAYTGVMRWRPSIAAAAILSVLFAGPGGRAALACGVGFSLPDDWTLVGANFGYAATLGNRGPAGVLLGGEISKAHLGRTFWYGGYADALYDRDAARTRLSFGPEVGFGVVGLDGGPLVRIDEGGVRAGVTVRPVLSVGLVSAYVRFGWLPGDARQDTFVEAGVLLKVPLPI